MYSNTIPIPDIKSEPCLLLCPHVLLLSLVFSDDAFAVPSLKTPDKLFTLWIDECTNQLECTFRDSCLGMPIFRKVESTVNGPRVSSTKAAMSATGYCL